MTTVGFLTWNTGPVEDSRGHQEAAESTPQAEIIPQTEMVPGTPGAEDSQCDKILLLGAGSDTAKTVLMIS